MEVSFVGVIDGEGVPCESERHLVGEGIELGFHAAFFDKFAVFDEGIVRPDEDVIEGFLAASYEAAPKEGLVTGGDDDICFDGGAIAAGVHQYPRHGSSGDCHVMAELS